MDTNEFHLHLGFHAGQAQEGCFVEQQTERLNSFCKAIVLHFDQRHPERNC